MFLKIYTPLRQGLTCIILFFFKLIGKAHSKLDLKIEEVLHINHKSPNLDAQ